MLSTEIIAVGSELLTPSKIDTNSLWLTEQLNQIGIEVNLKTVVGDDEEVIISVLREALSRSKVVISTGGLGPTEDDKTRTAWAKVLDRQLVFDPQILIDMQTRFGQMGVPMPEKNRSQAFTIDGSEILPNPKGTAPGLYLETADKLIVILPGPPREMMPMFSQFVLPKLQTRGGRVCVRRKILKVSGMGESLLDEMIAPIYTQYENPQTTILFNRTEVEVHLTARGENEREADAKNEQLASLIAEKLGIALFSDSGEGMETVVARMLTRANRTIAVAESCTGGLVAQRLTDVAGSSAYFISGVVAYSNEAKSQWIGVPETLINQHGAVSSQVAEAMASGLRQLAKTDYALSTTGIAGPSGGSDEKPVGTVHIGYSDSQKTKSIHLKLPGDRELIRWRASQAALDYLRRQMLKQPLSQ